MAVKTFAVGELVTASDANTYLANAGLVYVKQVTIGSGVSSVDVTSCFSSVMDNYVISLADVNASAGGGVIYGKLLVGTTPQTNGWYGNTFFIAAGGAGGLSNAPITNAATFEICCLTNTTNHRNSGICHIQSPNLPRQTRAQFHNADDYYFRLGASHLSNTTQYDGLQILPSSGTLTGGTITVYGYRKA